MNGRRAVIGLSLLIALLASAFAAQGASAAEGETTVFECAPVSSGRTFLDEHCDEKTTTAGAGFRHHSIAAAVGTNTEITLTNAKTASATTAAAPAILKSTNFLGAAFEASCNTVTGSGTLKNVAGPPMKVEGEGTIEFTNCTVSKPANKCKLKEPIVTSVHGESWAPNASEMGLKLTPTGANFTELTFEDKSATEICPATYKASAFPVKGNVIGTGHNEPNGGGATSYINPAVAGMTTLTLGASTATLEAVGTFRMKNGNPLVLTTPPFTE